MNQCDLYPQGSAQGILRLLQFIVLLDPRREQTRPVGAGLQRLLGELMKRQGFQVQPSCISVMLQNASTCVVCM